MLSDAPVPWHHTPIVAAGTAREVLMRLTLLAAFLAFGLAACSSDDNKEPGDTHSQDLLQDTASDSVQDQVEQDLADVAAQDQMDAQDEVDSGPTFPPRTLPFTYKRTTKGDPIPAEETTAFTKKVTGMWKKVDYFRWILRTSIGVDPSTGKDDYLSWHNDAVAQKSGDTVIFKEMQGEHNMWIPSSKVLSEALNGCILTKDWTVCKVAEQYCKGLTATVKGFIWDENDPAPYLMARAIFPMDQDYTLDEETWKDDGRRKIVEFHHMYHVEDNWNAHTFEWPHNPTWGALWLTNMRSKDDVCAIVRTTTFLPYILADAPYDWVRDACQETMDTMVGFNKDIVDHDYQIRTKDPDGTARLVTEQDLGNYTQYTSIDPKNECVNRLATDLIAYNTQLTNDCGDGTGTVYEAVSVGINHYNYPIIWNYHMAAIGNALVYGLNDAAKALLEGFGKRMDDYLSPDTEEKGAKDADWSKDMAVLLVQTASLGLPLNADEARLVQKHFAQAVTEFEAWDLWDLWANSVADGEYDVRPASTPEGIPVEAMALFLEYCNSPFKNPAGQSFVDCSIVADPSKWGE